jgi:hypothetical protein
MRLWVALASWLIKQKIPTDRKVGRRQKELESICYQPNTQTKLSKLKCLDPKAKPGNPQN